MGIAFKHIILICICIGSFNTNIVTCALDASFANPIFDSAISHASATKVGSFYYVALPKPGTELEILKSPYLTDFRNAESHTIYRAPPGYTSIAPSSFFKHEDQVYLYFFILSPARVYEMFVIKSKDATNLFDQWSAPTRILENVWNEDTRNAAAFQNRNKLYFVWSSSQNGTISLYIARMTSPFEVVSPVNLLRQPEEDWEGNINESPTFIYNRNSIYMVFPVFASTSPNNSLTYMSIDTDLDPMNSTNWVSAPGPVFTGNPEESVYGTRFPSFVTSPDGTENWMIYTSFSNVSNPDGTSRLRINNIRWNKDNGSPEFPLARGDGIQQQLPSGEPSKFKNPILDEHQGNPNACMLDEKYYWVTSNSTGLVMLKSDTLQNFRDAERSVIYTAPAGSSFITPRIIEIHGEFYIYLYMKTNISQIYVLKAANSSNLMQEWGEPQMMLNGVFDGSAYHGIVLSHNNKLYFVWASANSTQAVMYIAPMSSPTQVVEPAVLLKEPKGPWECYGNVCVNDYPYPLYSTDVSFLVYTVNGIDNVNCGLSYMSIDAGRDPLDVMNWYISPEPVFYSNDAESAYATCHASFTKS